MTTLLRFLTKYEIVFYILLGFVLIIFSRKVYLAWKEWSIALFGLEKEHTQRQINQGITVLIFTFALGVGLFIVTTFVAPAVPGIQQVSTPTLELTSQPAITLSTPTIITTTQGLIPTLTAILDRGCVADQIEWTDPVNGDIISGKYLLKGIVNVSNLGFFKYEYSPVDRNSWTTISAGSTPVIDDALGGNWDTSSLTPGDYQLRLIVTDIAGKPLPECVIKITITPPD